MTDLIIINDISDELPPAFMILDDESFDKTKILAIPKIWYTSTSFIASLLKDRS